MAAIVPIISAAAGIIGAVSQAGAQQNAAQAQANAAYYNAAVAQQNANAAMQAAYADKLQQDRENRSRIESVRSDYLGSGVLLEGTPLLVIMEETTQAALESDKILHRGKVQYANFQNQAQLQRYQGDVALAAAETKSSSTILGGAFSAASGLGRAVFAN